MTSPQDPWQQRGYQPYPQGGQPDGPSAEQSGHAQYQQGPEPEGTAPQRPLTVEVAFWIAVVVPLVATVLYAVNFFVTQGFLQQLLDQSFADLGPTPDRDQAVRTAAGVLVALFGVAMVFLVVLTALWIVFGFKLRAGRNWARVTLVVFAAIWAVSGLSGLVNGGSTWTTAELPPDVQVPGSLIGLGLAHSSLGLVAMVAFLVLVFLKPSNWYFTAAARFRR